MFSTENALDFLFDLEGKQLCLPILVEVNNDIVPITDVIFLSNPDIVYLASSTESIRQWFERYQTGIIFHRYYFLMNRLRERAKLSQVLIIVKFNNKVYDISDMYLSEVSERFEKFIADDIKQRKIKYYPILKTVDIFQVPD